MGFALGYVLGFALGFGLVVAFARFQNTRSVARIDLAAGIAALARMTVQDSRKLLPDPYYPSWVVFSQRQKLNWLNSHLDKIWPFVDELPAIAGERTFQKNFVKLQDQDQSCNLEEFNFLAMSPVIAASQIIRDSVEPIMEQYRPVILASLKFSTLTLGTVAPQFTGVTILDSEPNEIVMELDLQWDGNPDIVLDIKTRVGVALPIQVKNIAFTGVFRLIFKPLVDEFPCFGAVCYSLRHKKNLDFTLKVIGGDLSSIPGLSDAIEDAIKDAIEASITWPVRQIVPIIPGDYSHLEAKAVGVLEVKLIEAKELTNKDIIGKSDPYAKIFVRPLPDRTKTSKTIDNQTSPIWNEQFDFEVEDSSTQHLTIKVYDDEGVQSSELIGCALFQICQLEPGKVKDVWLKLVKDLDFQRDNKNRGQVHLELLYCPFSTDNVFNPFDPDFRLTSLEKALKHVSSDGTDSSTPQKAAAKKKDIIIRGVLSVTVVSAEELPATDLMGKSDPFVVLMIKKSEIKHKTRVLNDTLNPVWNQTFDFVVEDGLHELLILEVYDHDTFGKEKMGRCIMTLTRAILEGEFTDTFHIDGTESGKLNLHVKWSSQSIVKE